jgi:uncharacterized tellurite resistance protein B-like protein
VLDSIRRFFDDRLAAAPDGAEADRTRLQVATCALLLEVAHADDDFGAGERATIVAALRAHFDLSQHEADQLLSLARQEQEEATDLYQFARLINQHYGRAEKLTVLEQLWRVVYSDGRLEAHEDALMHKLATLLGLRHEELIAVKLQVKKEL